MNIVQTNQISVLLVTNIPVYPHAWHFKEFDNETYHRYANVILLLNIHEVIQIRTKSFLSAYSDISIEALSTTTYDYKLDEH